jgi:hypothetical protein
MNRGKEQDSYLRLNYLLQAGQLVQEVNAGLGCFYMNEMT